MAIPKIIHYCWVGGNPKPQSVLYCIDSWRRCCPDYEIREWNEENYDFFKNEYMRQAYEAKKWGFVPDYARLDIVYQHGGIYLDTDVELLRPLDELLEEKCFFGFENTGDGAWFVNCGHGFGAEPGNDAVKAARDLYEHLRFYREDGSLNQLASPYYTTQALRQFGLVQENRDQKLGDVQVFASDLLCPKCFRTGKVEKTARTVSVHHFSAAWVDEAIKQEMAHQQQIKSRWGEKLGGYVLLVESVTQKYAPGELLGKLPKRLVRKAKGRLIAARDEFQAQSRLDKAARAKPGTGETVILDTFLNSDNSGDGIIMENCMRQLCGVISADVSHVPTHRLPTEEETGLLRASGRKLLCGTNILSGHMGSYGLWRMAEDVSIYKNTVLMGVGFDSARQDHDRYSRKLFDVILDKNALHSVRDSFSERKLREMGITNVINTGCPTMWELTPAHCAAIPEKKGKNAICTVTDYCRDGQNDRAMLEILLANYETVYLWLQGREDADYIRQLGFSDRLILVGGTLAEYDEILEQTDLDYVGTRLHAGIRALRKGHRSLVISIDNRAECIAQDTNLPVLPREDVPAALENRLSSGWKTEIHMPWEAIETWKGQFEGE